MVAMKTSIFIYFTRNQKEVIRLNDIFLELKYDHLDEWNGRCGLWMSSGLLWLTLASAGEIILALN